MNEGLGVIGMVKKRSKRFSKYKGKNYSLKTFIGYYNVNQKIVAYHEGSLGSIQMKLNNGIPVKIVFIHHRKYEIERLAILSTNASLSDEELITISVYRLVSWQCEAQSSFASEQIRCHLQSKCI